MPASKATLDLVDCYELCIWLWAMPSEHVTVSTEEDCWLVRAHSASGRMRITIPTRDGTVMPDFDHPRWPAVRKALEKLRRAEV